MPKIQGANDHVSGEGRDAQRRFAPEGPVEKAAHATAEAVAAKVKTKSHVAHRERNLDEGLEETYPASDPVSIHPGSD